MFVINKITSCSAVDYAAEELKKYLRMMMPDDGDISIFYSPSAKSGIRLGLMQDFGLDTSDAENSELDDIIYIDTTEKEGIISGSNPRSVLIAVYEYLRQNGCRWLFPGVDGEYIPLKKTEAVKYRHKADNRYRGWCNEGAVIQESILEMIDFTAKNGMNLCMIQFKVPKEFYDRYYSRMRNEENRIKEDLSMDLIVQWTRQCEAEIAKRGLMLHSIGHGFAIEPFGIDSSSMWNTDKKTFVPEDSYKYLAEINGKRDLFEGIAVNTNFCMSNTEARGIVVDYIVDFAEKHSNIDYLHVWLGDGFNNHCECEECAKRIPSDWYMIFLNELDLALSKNNLNTRIVFCAYSDTSWAPLTEKINNSDRFALMLGPITRSYTQTSSGKKEETTPYVRNKLVMPGNLDAYLEHIKEWQNSWKGATFCYEYYFWQHQFYDPSTLALAERIYEDIHYYKEKGISGIIQCGSQRSFFPNGYAYYVHARTLFDENIPLEEIKEDYFSYAYGSKCKEVLKYFEKVKSIFDMGYLEGEKSLDKNISRHYNPSFTEEFKKAKELSEEGLKLSQLKESTPIRIRTVSDKLLYFHSLYINQLADYLTLKALGEEEKAEKELEKFRVDFGKYESEIERYFDHFLCFTHLTFR